MDTVQFVDRISSTPTVRLDLNDDVTWSLNYAGTDMSPPALKTATTGTLLTDGEQQTAAAYSNRVIKLSLDLKTASVDGQATAMQQLWRELDRPTNIIRWQPAGATAPVFLRTIRSSDTRVTDYPGTGTLRSLDVVIRAEPFALGLKETPAAVTVSNDPAAGANGGYLDLTTVKGDVETPLMMSMPGSATALAVRRTSVFGVRRRGTPSAMPYFRQAESLTIGTDVSMPGNDPLCSGSGSNYTRCSFATDASMQVRVSGNMTSLPSSVDLRGKYRVFARLRHSVALDVIKVQLQWAFSGPKITNDPVTLINGASVNMTGLMYYDLGQMQVPVGADPVTDGYSGAELPCRTPLVYLQAQRVSGTGNLDVDHLLFVPADDRLLSVKWPAGAAFSSVVDGTHNMTYDSDVAGAGTLGTSESSEIAGGFPTISPGATNRIFFIRQAAPVDAVSDDITNTTAIQPSYYPRYLSVRPATT